MSDDDGAQSSAGSEMPSASPGQYNQYGRSTNPPSLPGQSNYPPPPAGQSAYPSPLPSYQGAAHPITLAHPLGMYHHGLAYPSSGSPAALGPYPMPPTPQTDHHHYQCEAFTQAPPPITYNSPYPTHPPPLRPVPALPVSPNDGLQQEEPVVVHGSSSHFTEASNLDAGSDSSESSMSSNVNANRPAPAKSAFMCFSEANRKEISEKMRMYGHSGFVEAVAAEWRKLSKHERTYWERMAKNEKTRFAQERESYKGPLTRKLRAKKNPLAPKRPMSAFLMYAQQKRRPLQRENPDMPNADISRLLGELWRNTSMAEKRPFLEREERERLVYKAKMEAWKCDQKLAKSLKPLNVTGRRDGMKKQEQRQDAASSIREEPQYDQRYDPTQGGAPSHPANTSTVAPQHPETYRTDQTGSPSCHEYNYDTSNWASNHNHQLTSNPIKYLYPRPPEDQQY